MNRPQPTIITPPAPPPIELPGAPPDLRTGTRATGEILRVLVAVALPGGAVWQVPPLALAICGWGLPGPLLALWELVAVAALCGLAVHWLLMAWRFDQAKMQATHDLWGVELDALDAGYKAQLHSRSRWDRGWLRTTRREEPQRQAWRVQVTDAQGTHELREDVLEQDVEHQTRQLYELPEGGPRRYTGSAAEKICKALLAGQQPSVRNAAELLGLGRPEFDGAMADLIAAGVLIPHTGKAATLDPDVATAKTPRSVAHQRIAQRLGLPQPGREE